MPTSRDPFLMVKPTTIGTLPKSSGTVKASASVFIINSSPPATLASTNRVPGREITVDNAIKSLEVGSLIRPPMSQTARQLACALPSPELKTTIVGCGLAGLISAAEAKNLIADYGLRDA